MKSRDGKSQRREEKKKEDKKEKRREEKRREEDRRSKREEKRRRKKIQKRKSPKKVREKVGKTRNTVFFQWFVAPEGRKLGSLKRWVQSQLARWEMKNSTPLWREVHVQVKMYKTLQLRSPFRSWDVEKVRRAHFQVKMYKTPWSDHFWKLRCQKSARRCGAKHISKSKCTKHLMFGPVLEVEMTKKCTPLWRKAHFQVKMYKAHQRRTTFRSCDVEKSARRCCAKHISKSKCTKHLMFGPLLDIQMSFRVAGARDCAPCQKWAKREGFVAFAKMMAGMGHLKRICKDAFSVAGAVQETCSSELLQWEVRALISWEGLRFGAVLGRWFCVTGAALRMTWHQFFVAGAVLWTGGVEKSQNALVRGRQLSTQLPIFEGSLAELFRFWCCQLRKLRKSRSIVSFLMSSTSKIEEVSQNCFVFDVVTFKNCGGLAK